MSNYYNLDGIKTMMNKEIATNEARLQAWRNVTFPTKKDGTPFAAMAKNFDGATYRMFSWATYSYEKCVQIHCWADKVGYVDDEIQCYKIARYLSKDSPLYEKAMKNTTPDGIYALDLDDIKSAIQLRIEQLERHIELQKVQLTKLDDAYNEFDSAIRNAVNTLKDAIHDRECPSAYYAIRDTVKSSMLIL